MTSIGELTGPESRILLWVVAGKERVDVEHLFNWIPSPMISGI